MTVPAKKAASAAERPRAVPAPGVAQILSVSVRMVGKMNSSGRLPRPIHLGRSVRWSVAELEAWLAADAPSRDQWEAMR